MLPYLELLLVQKISKLFEKLPLVVILGFEEVFQLGFQLVGRLLQLSRLCCRGGQVIDNLCTITDGCHAPGKDFYSLILRGS